MSQHTTAAAAAADLASAVDNEVIAAAVLLHFKMRTAAMNSLQHILHLCSETFLVQVLMGMWHLLAAMIVSLHVLLADDLLLLQAPACHA